MKRFASTLCLLFLLVVGANATDMLSSVEKAHTTTYQISQSTILESAGCSATAVGPHALLTATHCELGSDDLFINGSDKPTSIVARLRDGQDHTIYLLKDASFPSFSKLDEDDPLAQGEDVFMFGNPGQWSNIYRRGYITGITRQTFLFFQGPERILFDFTGWHGDSGAGIFNQQGRIIAVMTGRVTQATDETLTDSIHMSYSFKLAFTPEQLQRAQTFAQE